MTEAPVLTLQQQQKVFLFRQHLAVLAIMAFLEAVQ